MVYQKNLPQLTLTVDAAMTPVNNRAINFFLFISYPPFLRYFIVTIHQSLLGTLEASYYRQPENLLSYTSLFYHVLLHVQ